VEAACFNPHLPLQSELSSEWAASSVVLNFEKLDANFSNCKIQIAFAQRALLCVPYVWGRAGELASVARFAAAAGGTAQREAQRQREPQRQREASDSEKHSGSGKQTVQSGGGTATAV
jgi:hypothetical protein